MPRLHAPNNFDFVRVVAALLVLVGHQFLLTGLVEPRVYGLYSLGDLGVCTFFSISGFLIAQSWHADPVLRRFAARRALRIWPGLMVLVLLTGLVLGPLITPLPVSRYLSDPQFFAWMGNLVLPTRWELPVDFGNGRLAHTVNGSLWTIALEVACYGAFAAASMAAVMRSRWFAPLFVARALGYYLGWLTRAGWEAHPFHRHALKLEFASYFVAGALWFQHRRFLLAGRLTLMCAVAVLVLHLGALALGKPLLALWLAVPFAVLAFGLHSTPVLRRAGRFGDLSYGLYLYAFTVQQVLIWQLAGSLPFGLLLAACVAVTGALAFASWHLVERPALRRKPGRPALAAAEA
ncbi:MAG: acyltransferase [Bdellovibrionales bacterium]|nr:acyltransferase [Ramlibacter sp.]